MIFKNAKLKGRIVEKFGSQKAFADALGVTDTTVNNKLNNRRLMSQDDIANWAETLEIPLDQIGLYFFTEIVKQN
jgi:transcriptional regulator with XRE-family HTH domain